MVKISIALIKAARPVHWVKNLSIFAALVFTGNLFDPLLFSKTIEAFVVFSLASSATYVFNDIKDISVDRLHPVKRRRPIASGDLPISIALPTAIVLAIISLSLGYILSPIFFFLVLAYLCLQIAYSYLLKHITVLDILVIATGFIIRVYAGAFAIDAHLSVWFLLCVVSVALFLASGKRRAELGVLQSSGKLTRESLKNYPKPLLDSYVTMFGNAAWMSWALFTFFESPHARIPLWMFLAEISRTTTISKLLMITIPVVIYGIMRYMSLIFTGKTEAPEKLLLQDKQLTTSVVVWSILVVVIIYGFSA